VKNEAPKESVVTPVLGNDSLHPDGAARTFDSACSHDRRRRSADDNLGSLRRTPGGLHGAGGI